MPSKNPCQRLLDIRDHIDLIERFTAGMAAPEFIADLKTLYAVERAILIVSEAIRRLPDDVKLRHSEIDWAAASGIGNKIRLRGSPYPRRESRLWPCSHCASGRRCSAAAPPPRGWEPRS